jgi:predicted ArsR family transcriptional regulator
MEFEKSSSTRDEILYIIKTQVSLPVSDIAAQLGITEMAVRRHLNTLERDQYIKTQLIRQAMGRPTHEYSLTEKGHDLFPKNYSDVTMDFLKDIEELEGQEMIDKLFERREARLAEKHREQMKGLPFEERVKVLAEIQNKKGYMVKWEKVKDGGYMLKEYNCPISQVAKTYHKACNCELSLFQKLLGTDDIQRPECLAKGGDHCVYMIKQNSRSS